MNTRVTKIRIRGEFEYTGKEAQMKRIIQSHTGSKSSVKQNITGDHNTDPYTVKWHLWRIYLYSFSGSE